MTAQSKAIGESIANKICEERLEALEKAGLTYTYLINKLKKELNAKDTKFFQHEGQVMEIREVIDWSTRQRARMDAHKLRGDYPAEKLDVTVDSLSDRIRDARERTKNRS